MAYTDPSEGSFLTRPGNYNIGHKILDQEMTLIRYIDAATDNLTSGAYYKLWSVPAGFALTEAYVVGVTAEGAADTVDIVDDDSATTTFVNDASVNSTSAIGATNARKHYAAAGFIVLLPNAAITVAQFYVCIKGIIVNTSM